MTARNPFPIIKAGRSMPVIGGRLGRGHAAVLHGVRAVERLLGASDPRAAAAVRATKERPQVLRGRA